MKKKRILLKILKKKQPNNPSIHQQNIVINNDSDESQINAVELALEHCPDDHEINHIASHIYQKDVSKGNHLNEEKKNKLNTFNNKLLQSNDEILQNDGLNLVNAQNEQNQILDKNTFNNLCSLQNSKNENTAIKASQLIADNLKINNSVDINKDEKIKTIINEGIKNENPLIQNNFLGIIAQKGNFDNKEDSKSITQICENNTKEGINLDYSLEIINNISNKKEGNNIVINNDTTEKLFSNLNNSSPDNKHNDKILSILNNSSTNLSKEQNDIYKNKPS